jgi:hypothetical protein
LRVPVSDVGCKDIMSAMHAVLLGINVLNVDELAILPVGADRLLEQGMVVLSGNGGEAAAESAVAIAIAKEGKASVGKKTGRRTCLPAGGAGRRGG